MPNIEIHGFAGETASKLAIEILKSLRDIKGLIVTLCPTNVINVEGLPEPFFRLLFTDDDQSAGVADGIIEALRGFPIDLECLKLEAFYSHER